MFSDEEMGDGMENHIVKVTSKPATLKNMNPYKEKAGESAEGEEERLTRGEEEKGWG